MIPDNLEPIETLEQGVALFERVGMPARDLAERTRHEYTNDLADLAAHLRQRGIAGLRQIDLQHLEGYQAEMDRRGYKASTRERKTYAIKSFFRFIHHHGVIDTNVALKLTPAPPQVRVPPRPKRPEPRFLSEEEYQRLQRVCSHDPRDAAIVEVLLQTGMRLSELARLTVHDVELPRRINREPDNTGSVRIRRKGGKEATIPLNRFARLARRWRRG